MFEKFCFPANHRFSAKKVYSSNSSSFYTLY